MPLEEEIIGIDVGEVSDGANGAARELGSPLRGRVVSPHRDMARQELNASERQGGEDDDLTSDAVTAPKPGQPERGEHRQSEADQEPHARKNPVVAREGRDNRRAGWNPHASDVHERWQCEINRHGYQDHRELHRQPVRSLPSSECQNVHAGNCVDGGREPEDTRLASSDTRCSLGGARQESS